MDLSEFEIKKDLDQYKARKQYRKDAYLKVKDDPEFQKRNRANSNKHYHQNKDKKKEYYEARKEIISLKNRYKYHEKTGKLDLYMLKYKSQYDKLVSIGFIVE